MRPSTSPALRSVLAAMALALLATACNQSDDRAAAAASASASAAPAAAGNAGAHDAHAPHAPPILPEGRRWATDEPLRAAMTRIREAVERSAPEYGKRQLQAAGAGALATAVEQDIAYMVANCRLEPDPDAALHALIGRMTNAAAMLKEDPLSDGGFPELVAVLHDYQATFDHPGWTAADQAH
jgi:hypothetical protein